MTTLTPSYATANQELVKSFVRYLESGGKSSLTIRKYRDTCERFVEALGGVPVVEAAKSDIRLFQAALLKKGLSGNSVRLHTGALRIFYKFINLAGVTRHNPMLLVSQRKVASRLPRVPSVSEVEALIGAARDPFERAVVEVLYATGVRVSEFVNLKVEDIIWDKEGRGSLRVHKGKGGKDRPVLFGKKAAKAIRACLKWRPSQAGYIFEARAQTGSVYLKHGWHARFYVNGVQHTISLEPYRTFQTKRDAEEAFRRLVEKMPGYRPVHARPYTPRAIAGVLNRLAHRAAIGHVHPHALRRALATHMLSDDADLRAIQDLLGHAHVSTTMRYTNLAIDDLKRVHERCHPHEARREGKSDGENE